jgi:hypothetical protein
LNLFTNKQLVTTKISLIAKFSPIHLRNPAPKGTYEQGGCFSKFSFKNRSGSNLVGSSHSQFVLCKTYGLKLYPKVSCVIRTRRLELVRLVTICVDFSAENILFHLGLEVYLNRSMFDHELVLEDEVSKFLSKPKSCISTW